MIAIAGFKQYRAEVEEFFQLFKTPWEFYRDGGNYDIIITDTSEFADNKCKLMVVFNTVQTVPDKKDGNQDAFDFFFIDDFKVPLYCTYSRLDCTNALIVCQKGSRVVASVNNNNTMVVLGYNIFAELKEIFKKGQPLDFASTPTIDVHISILRNIILSSVGYLIEIPPVPFGYTFFGCLTHDIDFIGIKNYGLDHSVAGFLYRAIPGSILDFLKGKIDSGKLFKNIAAAISLPFVHFGLIRDFWLQFDWYLRNEHPYPSTYFLSPFKDRAGENVDSSLRAMRYQASEILPVIKKLSEKGDEIGVHGIDAWHDVEKGREELKQITSITGKDSAGIRMHWLCFSDQTYQMLEKAGYDYDSTCGYNEMPGFKGGTFQPFMPPGCSKILEIPMHIQDCSMFYPKRMNLTEKEALLIIDRFIKQSTLLGGVLTCIWHDRSPGPERNWGNTYKDLINKINDNKGYFDTCSNIVKWFQCRRKIVFEQIEMNTSCTEIKLQNYKDDLVPPLFIRIFKEGKVFSEVPITKDSFTIIYDREIINTEMR